MTHDEQIIATYTAFKARVEAQSILIDPHSIELVKIAREGMFDCYKTYYREDLERLGLESKTSYTNA